MGYIYKWHYKNRIEHSLEENIVSCISLAFNCRILLLKQSSHFPIIMLVQDKYELTEVSSCQTQKTKERDNILSERFSCCLILLSAPVQTLTFFNEEMVCKNCRNEKWDIYSISCSTVSMPLQVSWKALKSKTFLT